MNTNGSWRYTALASAAMLAIGCAPEDSGSNRQGAEGGAAQSAPGTSNPGGVGASRSTPPPAGSPPAAAPGTLAAPGGSAAPLVARAQMMPVGDGAARGMLEFRSGGSAPLMINVMLTGLPAGPHGFHVHEGSDCAMPGEHWNPAMAPHGDPTAAATERHRGDLGNITADASGNVQASVRDSTLGNDRSYIGKVVVVHSMQDDLRTQPGGGSGDPVACGVIQEAEGANVSQAPGGDRGV